MQQIMLLNAHLADFELLRRVRGGDKECYEVLVRRYTRLLYRVARIFRMENEEAEALTIEIFAETYGERRLLKEANYYRLHIAQRMISRCKNLARHSSEPDFISETEGEEVEVAIQTDKLNILEKAIDALSASLRAPVILCALESFSAAEAGKLLGLSADVIDARLKLANSRMRGRLLRWYHEEDIFSCDSFCADRVSAAVMARI